MGKPTEVTILLVDDDEVDVRGLKRALRKHGVNNPIQHACDGLEALEILRGENEKTIAWPFLILLDINMPRMNGIEFLDAIRADAQLRDAVVFMLTTSDAEPDMTAAYRHHVAGYVLKSSSGPDFTGVATMIGNFAETVRFPQELGRAEPNAA